MEKKLTIIVIGGAHGGPTAAFYARQNNENARIILIEKNAHITWVQASLYHYLAGDEEKIKVSLQKKEAYFREYLNIEIRTNTEVISLDIDSKAVIVRTKNNKEERLGYDTLIYAGGAINNTLDLPHVDLKKICYFRNLDHIKAIKEILSKGAKKALVVGLGFYGVEAALALRKKGLDVTIIDHKKRVFPKFSFSTVCQMLEILTQNGIKILLGQEIKNTDYDLIIICTGTKPRSDLLSESGAALDVNELIRVDDYMATTLPHVFACGSSISVPHAISHERQWLPHGAVIERTAMIAGLNASSLEGDVLHKIKPFCGTFLLDINGIYFGRTGLTEEEAKAKFGDDIIWVTVFGNACEEWLKEDLVFVKLLINEKENLVLGGEVFGPHGVDRRLDLIALSIMEKWPIEKLMDLDMAYEPSLGPAFDPLKEASLRASLCKSSKAKIMSAEKLLLWLNNNEDFCLVNINEQPINNKKELKNILHIPFNTLRSNFAELKNIDKPIVFLSPKARQSFWAAQSLSKQGVENVFYLDGGFSSWHMIH